jgi:hypothetical protein
MAKENFHQFVTILEVKESTFKVPLYRTDISNGSVVILRLNERLYWN